MKAGPLEGAGPPEGAGAAEGEVTQGAPKAQPENSLGSQVRAPGLLAAVPQPLHEAGQMQAGNSLGSQGLGLEG